VAGGHCAAFLALAEAATALSAEGVERALVVCVDSLSEAGRLADLDRAGAVRSARSPDGFTPGEGAVALLVALQAKVTGAPRAVVTVGAIAQEPVNDGVRMPSGAGLAEALRSTSALPHAEAAKAWVLCDLNGSTRRHYEWAVAQTRLGWPGHRLVHPADCLGDVGAVSGGVHIALACEAFARGWAPAAAATAWTAADDGTRLAAIISKGSLWR
jgi:3-oxoacyl-[acyl-carrier-protein] synthase-1